MRTGGPRPEKISGHGIISLPLLYVD